MRLLGFLLLALAAVPAAAQPAVQTPEEALAQDAGEYSRRFAVTPEEAARRLMAQRESAAATETLRARFAKRLAGIAVEHTPEYRIVVLLTGSRPVRQEAIEAGGMRVPVVFRTGARATQAQLVRAVEKKGAAIRAAFPEAHGIGVDPRRGELVVALSEGDKSYDDLPAVAARIADIAGVPARVRVLERPETDLAGGARVEGTDATTGRHAVCTAGFMVTDGARTGLATAAHCPDVLTYTAADGTKMELPFVGQWGWSFQDVQVNLAPSDEPPLFYLDRDRKAARAPAGQRSRAATRAGDWVCHVGQRTGYSCAEVELTDYSPPGELCGGPCAPTWVTVAGPACGGGDSGGPVFSGDVAYGIMKGGTWEKSGRCSFYYYMSLDYLPKGWALAVRGPLQNPQRAAPAAGLAGAGRP